MGAPPANDNSGETALRLAAIEGLLNQVLQELRRRRRSGAKRVRSVQERCLLAAMEETVYKPTELQIAAARRALGRKR
jgi:hypothetical protein